MKNKIILFITLYSGCIINADNNIKSKKEAELQQLETKKENQINFETRERATLAFLELISSDRKITREEIVKASHFQEEINEIVDYPEEVIENTIELLEDLRKSPSLKKCFIENFESARKEMRATTFEDVLDIREKSALCNELLMSYAMRILKKSSTKLNSIKF